MNTDFVTIATREAVAARNAPPEPWPDTPRVPGPEEPEAMPLDSLPAGIGDYVQSVAQNLQVPTDLPVTLALGTLSAALAGRVEVQVRSGWREPVGIYTAAVLPPAGRKSPAYAMMTEPLRMWEADAVRRAAPRVLAARDVLEVAERRLDAAKKAAANGKAQIEEVEACRFEVERARSNVPPDGRLLAGDVTPEAMTLRMAAQGGRLAIMEPEPGPLQLLAGRYSDTARLDEIKKAWSGETLLVDRVGRAPLRVPRPALTLSLCLQPGVLSALQNGAAFRVEGVLGRVLWCQPPHGLGTRLTGEDVPTLDEEARGRFLGIVGMLLGVVEAGMEEDGTPIPHVLPLSADALGILHNYEAEVEHDLGDDGRFASIRDWAGKCVGQSVRVAALLELAARAGDRRPLFGDPLGPWAMTSGVAIMRALSTHALAVLGEIGDGQGACLARYVLRRAVELPGGSTLRDLWQACRGRSEIGGMDDLVPLVHRLVDGGCIRLVEPTRPGPGRPPSPEIEIHPTLRESVPTIPTITGEHPPGLNIGDSGVAFWGGAGNPDLDDLDEEDRQYLRDEREGMMNEALL